MTTPYSNSDFHYTSYTVGTVLTRNTDTRPMPMWWCKMYGLWIVVDRQQFTSIIR